MSAPAVAAPVAAGAVATEAHGAVRLIRLTGEPRRGNPLSRDVMAALLAAVDAANADPAVRCLVIAGTERYFSVGADITEFMGFRAIEAVLSQWLDDLDRLRRNRKPLIAAVRGHAVGGGFELALLCDLIVTAGDARFSLPETGIGVIAGSGGSQRLIALAGRAIATDLILTGRVLDGAEAAALGIAARVVPADRVIETALAVAASVAARSAAAVGFAREILYEATEAPIRQSLRIERLLACLVLDTEERRERTAAFAANRAAGPPADPS